MSALRSDARASGRHRFGEERTIRWQKAVEANDRRVQAEATLEAHRAMTEVPYKGYASRWEYLKSPEFKAAKFDAGGISPADVKAALEAEGWSPAEVVEAMRRFKAMQTQGRQGRPDAGKVVVERRGGEERREFDSKEEAARFIQREGDNNRLWKYARSDLSAKEQEDERAFLEKYKDLKPSQKVDAIVAQCADLAGRLDAVCAERVAMHRGKDGGPRSQAGAVRGDAIHPEFSKYKHLATVREAQRKYIEAYKHWASAGSTYEAGAELKEFERAVNVAVEKAMEPGK